VQIGLSALYLGYSLVLGSQGLQHAARMILASLGKEVKQVVVGLFDSQQEVRILNGLV
jgi:hypothetical protein